MTAGRYFEYPDSSPRAQNRQRGIFPSITSSERWKLLQRPKDNGGFEIGTATRQDNRRRKLLCRRRNDACAGTCDTSFILYGYRPKSIPNKKYLVNQGSMCHPVAWVLP
ncbi:uncharacterized protein [Anoplolepis gracilipes]|uniref:uncharacterized protein isoform X3 n=1 Tax=Anoplolepis gracilipes TaxID=354296 RepID=UPI003B9E1B1C